MGHGDRRQGSLIDVAAAIHQYVRDGGDNPSKEFNLTRYSEALDHIRETLPPELARRKKEARERLYEGLDAARLRPEARLTGMYFTRRDVIDLPGQQPHRPA